MGLLTANYNGEGTGAAALALDAETDEVILGQAIDVAGLDADGFLETVETFVKYLTYWTEHLPTLVPSTSADHPAVGTSSPSGCETDFQPHRLHRNSVPKEH